MGRAASRLQGMPARPGADPVDLGNEIKGDVGSVDYDYKPLPLRILNNGHTIQVNADPGSACVIGGARYELLQFHLHHPSEHLLAGRGFDLECHFVHKSGAGALGGDRRVHSARPQANPPSRRCSTRCHPRKARKCGSIGMIDAAAVLPKSGGYFRYMGSLTTPPCSEGLTWTVYKEPVEASADQIRKFAALFPKNARPVQKLQSPLPDRCLLIAVAVSRIILEIEGIIP